MFKLNLEKTEEPDIKLPLSIGSSKKQGNSRKTSAAAAKSLHSCPTLCDPIDDNPPGSSIPGIPQARTLEWVAITFSFIDYAKAFDYVDHIKLWKILQEMGNSSDHLSCLLRNLYAGQEATVRTGHGTTD